MRAQAKITLGQLNFATTTMEEPNLLLGDAIMNFRTVQSFGYEEKIVQQYLDMMKPIDDSNYWQEIQKSFFIGFVQFLNFITNALLFLIASWIFSNEKLVERYDFTTQDVFTAIFCSIFVGQSVG